MKRISHRGDKLAEVTRRVASMPRNSNARQAARRHGLAVQSVSWEDTARTKNSCYGPNISDMTLQVRNTKLPVIRAPNFADSTWDMPIDKIEVACGNERDGEPLHRVLLQDYLSHLRAYLSDADSWEGCHNSVLADRDTHVVMSAQACFLPVPEGAETTFNACLYNYQSSPSNPAVLAIVATANGTSAQVIENGEQKLYFNKAGEKASFVSQRLRDNRRERGVALEGEMSAAEKASNVVMIIQVPLKRREPVVRPMPPILPGFPTPILFSGTPHNADSFGAGQAGILQPQQAQYEMPSVMSQVAFLPKTQMAAMPRASGRRSSTRRREKAPAAGIDHAIVKVGESEGRFKEINGVSMERDERFPIRVTLQFYKATDTGEVDAGIMDEIAMQIGRAKSHGDFFGSLVTDVDSEERPTAPSLPHPAKRSMQQPVFTEFGGGFV